MLHVGLDLSRKRVDVCALAQDGTTLCVTTAPPDRDGLRGLARRLDGFGQPVHAVIESMNGARFVHDQLELAGWDVEVADAQRAKRMAPLACKTDRIDARVLAELSRRDLVPAIWLPTPGVRADRERSRWRLHLVRHRTALKNRVHAALISFGHPCPTSDLFGADGRRRLERMAIPEPWRADITAALHLIDELDDEIAACEADLRRIGSDHPYIPLLISIPGISWVLAATIAAEIGDIHRFDSPKKLVSYTGLCPRVYQSGAHDHRGPLTKSGPKFLRWALIEASFHAAKHPAYAARYERTKHRLGRQRGPNVARVEVARHLTEAIWHMLATTQPFRPAGPAFVLVA